MFALCFTGQPKPVVSNGLPSIIGNRSISNRCLPSSALPNCEVKIQKLPIRSEQGRNWKVVRYNDHTENNSRRQHGVVMSDRGGEDNGKHRQVKESDSTVPQKEVHKNQRIQKNKNTRTKDYYTYVPGDIDSGAELLNDTRRKLVDSLSGTVKNHSDSKDGIHNRFPRRAKMRGRSYVELSSQESSSDEHD